MKADDKIYVAGHRGLAGSAMVRALQAGGFTNLILKDREALDLEDTGAVADFFKKEKPAFVFIAAARAGGIMANSKEPVEFLLQNLKIQNNLIESAYEAKVKKLLFLGSSCIYPRLAAQPIREDSLLTGPLEETNRAYAIAKIAGIELCQSYAREYGANFISVMPTNLYGPGDRFEEDRSHVIPALIMRFDTAKKQDAPFVEVWGTGTPKREFLHVDDLGEACMFLMQEYDDPEIINVGAGSEVSIQELAQMIKDTVGYIGEIRWDASKPDGTPRKLLDSSRIHTLGWKSRIQLSEGLRSTYEWYAAQ